MRLECERVDGDQYYSVGFHPVFQTWVLSDLTGGAAMYCRYYRISKEEYDLFDAGRSQELRDLRMVLNKEGVTSERFLYSEHVDDNTTEISMKCRELMQAYYQKNERCFFCVK